MFVQVSCSFWPTHPMLEQCSAISSSEFGNLACITKIVSQTGGIAPRAPTTYHHSTLRLRRKVGQEVPVCKTSGNIAREMGRDLLGHLVGSGAL